MGVAVCGREAGTEGSREPPNTRSRSYGQEPAEKTESHEQKWWKQISGESKMKLNVSFSCM